MNKTGDAMVTLPMKNVEWEKVNLAEFEALKEGGVCVWPLGCVELHGPHLPMGMDILQAHAMAVRAARIAGAIVAPRLPLGFTFVSNFLPGAINTPIRLLTKVWENFCDEIARNGFKKILAINCHGGNGSILDAFHVDLLRERRDYMVCLFTSTLPPEIKEVAGELPWGHACVCETSQALDNFPELVAMDALPEEQYPHRPGFGMEGVKAPVDWNRAWPENYVGDARGATAEKGSKLNKAVEANLVKAILALKENREASEFVQRFYDVQEQGGAAPDFRTGHRRES